MIQFRLAELRKKRRLTQQELADVFNVSHQTISKWENGTAYPDLSLLPQISSYFGVSVDALLGLVPLETAYQPSGAGSRPYWDSRLEYLKKTRKSMWNEDYLSFLIHSVWNLHQPVRILDCGCGYGALGLMLMPLLPKGSSYTGIDFSKTLLEEGKACFQACGLEASWIAADLRTYVPERPYDVVISQAVLRHMDDGEALLHRMVSWAVSGGMVISIETNREFEADGLYLHGMDYSVLCRRDGLSRMWQTEKLKQGRDHGIAMKIPHFMKEAGLIRIGCRMNDCVTILEPSMPDYSEYMDDLIRAHQWDRELSEDEQEKAIAYFMNHGMSRKEATDFCTQQSSISAHLRFHSPISLTHAGGMMISYGWKN